MEFHSELLDATGAAVLKDQQVWRFRFDKAFYEGQHQPKLIETEAAGFGAE